MGRGGAVAVVVLVAVWIASGWGIAICYPTSSAMCAVSCGQLTVTSGLVWGSEERPRGVLLSPVVAGARPFVWWFEFLDNGVLTARLIPLWFPPVLVLIPTALAWWSDRRVLRRGRIGYCSACGYDRRGLSATSVCPECGTAGKAFIEP